MTRALYILAGACATTALGGLGVFLAWASTALFGPAGFVMLLAAFVPVIGGLCGWMIWLNRRP